MNMSFLGYGGGSPAQHAHFASSSIIPFGPNGVLNHHSHQPQSSPAASTSAVPYGSPSPASGANHDGNSVGIAEGLGKKGVAGQKRKKSGSGGSAAGGDGAADGTDGEEGGAGAKAAKKAKIPRACDTCRRKKIRCNPIPDQEPAICTYCQKHKLDCTWFLPISETRFKKQREKEEAEKEKVSGAAAAVNLPTAASSATLARQHRDDPYPQTQHVPSQSPSLSHQHSIPPQPMHQSPYTAPPAAPSPHGPSPEYGHPATPGSVSGPPRKEPRIVGYTSISHLMHSTSTFPTERIIPLDFKYSQTLSVDERGDGFIRVISAGDGEPSGDGAPVAIQGIEHSDAEKLLNYYFTTHATHFPIVSRADFLGTERPTALLFNCICAVSALSHHVAPAILRTIKATIRSHLRSEDILDNSNIPNIQALLLYAFTGECEKGTAASKTWNILGLAIRMAQDLGLHRRLGTERKEQSEADHTELRRRVWGGCLIADRWMAAIYGQPMMIDLADCDAMLPSVFDIRPNRDFNSDHRPYLFNSALISLSVLLGRILKGVYSPTGILMLSEKEAKSLVSDLAAWVDGLPEELKFAGPEKSSPEQGFLRLLYIPVRFLITRPFMRISFQLPERFANLSVGTQQWSVVETETREAIEWVDKHESCLEGWFVGIYAFFICSLIQYHSHIRRRDATSLATLRLARDVLKRLVMPEGECFVRAKIAEITSLLYSTACSVSRWAPEAAEGLSPAAGGTTAITTLNPTFGGCSRHLHRREQDWHMRYKKDGGYFVTDRRIVSDPTGLIRSSHSPSSSGPSPRGHDSPYSSSLRSTHIAGDHDEHRPISATNGNSAPSTGIPSHGAVSGSSSANPNLPTGSAIPAPTSTAGPSSSFVPPAPNPPPDLSFAFPDSTFDNLSFNPTLNINTNTSSAAANDIYGTSTGMSGLEAFDPFGFASDGTPSLFPDGNIFNLGAWENFASSLNISTPGSSSAHGAEGTNGS
ncbi:SPOSA6832_03680 [Sporobolomyces salmonicolor]|uniref:SPOSA6832_03680-mRNA-1:cds n=1 Tax=Sporidiobolus salmonicolor TaxID=5005 RepID=A0A0D6EQ22_SPOSA|nr:SPOSA6832_03680 [Sporobolomyces salmonicolor]